MLKRIDIFMPPFSQYGVLGHMTRDLHDAFKRQGVNSRLLIAEHDNPKPFLDAIFEDSPDCTLSFNGLLPSPTGLFFCDMIKIPHVACLVDSPNQFMQLIKSPRTVITCPDKNSVEFFKGFNAQNVLFFPHGVNKDLVPDPKLKKKYDVVFLASCIDYEANRNSWKDKYPKNLCDALDLAAEITLSDQTTSYVDAFVQALDVHMPKEELDPNKFQLLQILDDLEMYIRGKDRVNLVKSIKDARADIFGAGKNEEGWKKYIGKDHSNITVHDSIPYEEALEVMKQSKIVLSSCPWIKNGGHERIFAGIACGALVITSENPYMATHFTDGKDIAFYYHNRLEEVNALVNDYLKNEDKRLSVAEKGRKIVQNGHTWDHRVESLIEQLPTILEGIRELG